MSMDVRDTLLEELERPSCSKSTMDELVRDVLVATLELDKPVYDAMTKKRPFKKNGEPITKEDECKADDPSKCWKHGHARYALSAIRKDEQEKKSKLNPRPTKDADKEWKLEKELREAGWEIREDPFSNAEVESMKTDMNNLRLEAGMKKLDSSYAPYANYLAKWDEYKKFKKQTEGIHKQAGISLARHHYDDVEEMLETLKKRPQELLAKFNEIQEAYEECCGSLCDEIEKNSVGRKSAGLTSTEDEFNGCGMLSGETSNDYQKRMKKLGKSKDVPETIKNIDSIVAKTERRWKSVAGIGQDEFDTIKANFRKSFENLMKGCSLASNVSIAGLNGVLEDHLKSQHDLTKKGERYDDGNYSHNAIIGGNTDGPRYVFAQKCFGVDKELKESKYEKYGCLHTATPRKDDRYHGGQYGKNVIRWKPDHCVASMTFTDSLCLARSDLNYVNPCLVSNPSPCCFNPANGTVLDILKKRPMKAGLDDMCTLMGTPYCELQLHGDDVYNAEAIESIAFDSAADVANLSRKAIESILTHNIPIYIEDKPIQIDENGKIKNR